MLSYTQFMPSDHAAANVSDLAAALSRALRRSVACRIGTIGLTPARLRALRHLAAAGGPMRMGELAGGLGVVPRSATSLIDELSEAGLVERTADPDDRRATRLTLTDSGREALETTDEMRRQAASELLGHLSSAELDVLSQLLTKAIARDT